MCFYISCYRINQTLHLQSRIDKIDKTLNSLVNYCTIFWANKANYIRKYSFLKYTKHLIEKTKHVKKTKYVMARRIIKFTNRIVVNVFFIYFELFVCLCCYSLYFNSYSAKKPSHRDE